MSEQNNDDWIPWNGGNCPVPPNTLVEVKFDSGEPPIIHLKARLYYWGNNPEYSNIVAYRVVKETNVEQAKQEPAKKPHKHLEVATKWLSDMSLPLQCRDYDYQPWVDYDYEDEGFEIPNFNASMQWRIKPADEAKQECVSPLSDDELQKIWFSTKCEDDCNRNEQRRAIANAAHKAALKWVAELPTESSLTDEEVEKFINETKNRHKIKQAQLIAGYAIAGFQDEILKLVDNT